MSSIRIGPFSGSAIELNDSVTSTCRRTAVDGLPQRGEG